MKTYRRARAIRALTVALVLSIVVAACGGQSEATPTPPPTPTAAASVATPAPSPTAEVAATPTKATGQAVTVDALWFGQDASGPIGGTSTVKVQVREKDDHELRVGFFESEVGGTGDQWRAAGWMSVITSSLLLGIDPSDHEFTFDVAGRIDGPSAGALMTVAVLAGYLGDEVKPDVTMTGTINPDGTIGPVGGIPHKIEGAAEAGKTLVLVPAGQRYDYDYNLQQAVDLVEAGKKVSVDVQLVSDIYEAYRLLTGSSLPNVAATGPRAAFPPRAFDKLRAGAITWIAKYQEERNRFTALPPEVQEYRLPVIEEADYYAGEADRALGEGQAAVAYQYAVYAATDARVAAQAAEFDQVYFNQGLDALIPRLDAAASAVTRMGGVLERLKAETPRTASDAVVLMDAYSNLSIAQGLVSQADSAIHELVNSEEYTEDDLLTTIYTAAYDYASADIYLDLVENTLSTGMGFGQSGAPDVDLLTAMSETLRRGAEANIRYFETLIVDPWAERNNVHPNIAKYYFMQYDSDYLNAVAASVGGQNLAAGLNEPAQAATLTLGSALTAYSSSASVLAKYYSLGAQLDENANVVGFERSAPLADMLDLADQRSSDLLKVVSEEEPVSALYYYENARILRQGGPADQLLALNYYWQSAILSQLLGVFSGTLAQQQ